MLCRGGEEEGCGTRGQKTVDEEIGGELKSKVK